MDQWIKNPSCRVYSVHDNNDMCCLCYLDGLVDTASVWLQITFSGSDLDGVMNCFGYSIATEVDMQYRGSNIVFDASVWDDQLESRQESSKILSSLRMWALLISLSWRFTVWKEKWLSTKWNPEESSLWEVSKGGRMPLSRLLELTQRHSWFLDIVWMLNCPKIINEIWYFLNVGFPGENEEHDLTEEKPLSKCWHPLIFWRWIGMRHQ